MSADDKRLIEDYLPIEKISAEASREKSVRKGHISTLHLWWARRPLVACRAAVYGALVPASRFVPNGASDEKKKSLGRANAAKFVERLCQYPGNPSVIAEAQKHILEAHAERLTRETGKMVTVGDIETGRVPRPTVLDMFAGGGAIPLEALRLGCEAYALDLNPVAHIIELCTLVYPQKYGKPDPSVPGMTGPKNTNGETTWGGLAQEVRHWGNWVLGKVRTAIADLYPAIPDPQAATVRQALGKPQLTIPGRDFELDRQASLILETPAGYLTPLAYLWTRTVTCKNPRCGATVPLVKQRWLCKRPGRFVALNMLAPKGKNQVQFAVVEARSQGELGFDPEAHSKGGNAACLFCGTVTDSDYVKAEGCAGRMSIQPMAVVCTRPGKQGKIYAAADDIPGIVPDSEEVERRIREVREQKQLTVPDESIVTDAKNCCWVSLYGFNSFGELFLRRQALCLLAFAAAVREIAASTNLGETNLGERNERRDAIAASLACWVDRLADFNSTLCTLKPGGERGVVHSFTRPAIPLVWDFAEANPFGTDSANASDMLDYLIEAIKAASVSDRPAATFRGSATALPVQDASLDAVICDPPYYDNVPYADVSDFFYVWLKRSVGIRYPEHFASEGTPKRQEAVADASRHQGSKENARRAYEGTMAKAFSEAHRALKPEGQLVVVYAHKTTLGWATLVEALRDAGFVVNEAWPLDTEMKSRLRSVDSAALASSIFLVARKRDNAGTRSYEDDVQPELERVVRERVDTLWNLGISGADLVLSFGITVTYSRRSSGGS